MKIIKPIDMKHTNKLCIAYTLFVAILVAMSLTSCATSSGASEYGNNNYGGGWGMESKCGKR